MPGSTSTYKSILVSGIILPASMLVNIFICFKIYKKFKNNIGPVHIFILNYFGAQSLQFISYEVIQVFVIFSSNQDLCNEYFFSLLTSLTWHLGIISMHIDRFAAIFWNIHCKEKVTTSKAISVCILNIITAASLSCLAKFMDNQYSNCTSPEIIVYTRTTNILFDGLTKFLVSVVTVVVSIYVFIKKKGLLKNTVHTVPSPSAVSTVFKSSGT